ncbi:ATP-dependent helicase [Candidatus Woesebacteria bacterium]|nr:ATP-dependent helicase [Candidatus Woesebacteria bacterium]MCD8507163.1 ATP-dependent helicase [Candidatus Woesebacteria bacterium]MCD8545944.1 ATP-dependent helicase [Candidatus Woesebacteria bacterium]
MAAYTESLNRLNPEQRLAVETTEGPVFVLAGPGTGKTQILSTRIAHILATLDVKPHNILALTFTQAAAKNMQQRLVDMIGADGYGVKCTTFHSFCTEVIESHQELFPLSPQRQEPIAEVDKISIVEQILLENDFEHIKSAKNPLYFVRDCLHLISNYKREGHSPLSIRELAEEEETYLENNADELTKTELRSRTKTVQKNRELAQVYAEYERQLRERHTYDFEDMILWVRDAFRNDPDVLAEYQETYQYFLVDEWQDTNEAQLQLLELLASHWGQQANVFAVGDPNQSIYRFQGASLANTFHFLDLYPNATVVALRTGYRGRQSIYDAAATAIAHNSADESPGQAELMQTLSAPLQSAHQESPGEVWFHEAPNTLAECFWVAQAIRERHDAGVPLSEIAVLVRKHSHMALLESVLARANIRTQITRGEDVLQFPLIQKILVLLRFLSAVRTQDETELFVPLLQQPWWDLDPTDALQLIRAGSKSKDHNRSVWDFWGDEAAVAALPLVQPEKVSTLRKQLIAWQDLEAKVPLPEFVETVLREAGIYAHSWQGDIALTDINIVASFLREVQSWYRLHTKTNLAEFLDRLERMQAHGLGIPADDLNVKTEAVPIVTAHQAKGQEWDTVFVLHVQDGYWGNIRSPQNIQPLPGTIPYADSTKDEKNADERRLFYVALSRAKRRVIVSWSQSTVQGGRVKELQPSQFVVEIRETPHADQPALSAEAIQSTLQNYLETASSEYAWTHIDREWLASLVDSFAMSVSALNEYLACPVGFLYKRLIRIPSLPTRPLVLGTAVHAAMERLYRDLNLTGTVPDLAEILPRIDAVVNPMPLSLTEVAEISAQAKTILSDYYHEHKESFTPSLLVEKNMGRQPPIAFEGLQLVGKIDRVDMLDAAAQTVCVIDYKTGTPKSRNHILGKTKNSEGDLYRQLLFYKLLGDLDSSFAYTIREGEFVFLEKNPTGRYKSERIQLADEDLDELKDLLRQVRDELQSLHFLEREPCGQCEICEMLGLQKDVLAEQVAEQQLTFPQDSE